MPGELGPGDQHAHRQRQGQADQQLAAGDQRRRHLAEVGRQRDDRRQRERDQEQQPDADQRRRERGAEHRRGHQQRAGAHHEDADALQRRQIHQRTISGRRSTSRSAKPASRRSIHGNVSAKVDEDRRRARDEGEHVVLDRRDRLEDAHEDAGDEAGGEHGQAHQDGQLDGLTDDADDKGF